MFVLRFFSFVFVLLPVCVLGAQTPPPKEVLRPKHITAEAQLAVNKGLAYLAKVQSQDGSYQSLRDGSTYPLTMTAVAGLAFMANGNTTSRGPYADNVRKAARFIMKHSSSSGLLVGPGGGATGGRCMGTGFRSFFSRWPTAWRPMRRCASGWRR